MSEKIQYFNGVHFTRDDNSGYYGNSACLDMQNIVKTYKRKSGIITIAAAIGSDKAAIEKIYGSDNFLDVSELDKLPLVMTNIIIKNLKL